MKTEIKIGIVEDELLIAEKIKMILTEIGYSVCEPVSGFEEAIEMIANEKLDLLLLDINLGKEKDGIHIAEKINELFFLPFIFLTANSDSITIERAKAVKPYAYLVKPFTKEELFAAIEIAIVNFTSSNQAPVINGNKKPDHNYIFIKENNCYNKILFVDILYIESRENYVIVHTATGKNASIRSTFTDFLQQLPGENFFRTHRSYAIQVAKIEHIDNTAVTLGGQKIPLSNSYKESLFSKLGIK